MNDNYYFDINCCFGRGLQNKNGSVANAAELINTMDAAGISKALVWHVAECEVYPEMGNALCVEGIKGEKRLCGVWTIMPVATEEMPPAAKLFEQMKESGVKALRAFPGHHNYRLNQITFGSFFDEVSERGIPILLSIGKYCGWDMLETFLSEYPKIVCVVCDIGVWGQARRFYPLLDKFSNLYVETSLISIQANGLADGVKKFGSERFVFGTGFPDRYMEASLLDLKFSRFSDEEKKNIAHLNLEHIIERSTI